MPWNGSGTFGRQYGSSGWVNDRNAGTKILATRHDTNDDDLADGINNCLTKDGQNSATANLNLGNNRITSLANPSGAQDAATKAYVDLSSALYFLPISGLTYSNGPVDTVNDIQVNAGTCADSTGTVRMTLSASLIKRLDASWVAGTNNGGLFSGVAAPSTWYYLHLIRKDSDGTIDAGFDTSKTAANKPVGYTYYRRIGAVRYDGTSSIINFICQESAGGGVSITYKSAVLELSAVTQNSGAWTSRTMSSIPPISCAGKHVQFVASAVATSGALGVRATGASDASPPAESQIARYTSGVGSYGGFFEIPYDSVSTFETNATSLITTALTIVTRGYEDFRRS